MASSLPDRIDPWRLGRNAQALAGDLCAGRLERLAAALDSSGTTVKVELQFGRLDRGIPFIEGVAALAGSLECQRCLEPMTVCLSAEFRLAVLRAGEPLPDDATYEPLELEEPELSISRLVEDELLLALPEYPVHAQRCQVADASMGVEDDGSDAGADSPFAMLASLKELEDTKR